MFCVSGNCGLLFVVVISHNKTQEKSWHDLWKISISVNLISQGALLSMQVLIKIFDSIHSNESKS